MMVSSKHPWNLLRWVGLTALFVAFATNTSLRPALVVCGVLWSLIATLALYRQQGGRWRYLLVGAAIFVLIMLVTLNVLNY